MMPPTRRLIVAHLSLVVGAFALACGAAEEPTALPIPRVKVYEVGDEAFGQMRALSGELAAANESPLSFGVAGTVDQVGVSEGAAVEEGQLLATLDPQPLRLALAYSRSELATRRAKAVEAIQAYERASDLAGQGVISKAQIEVATANRKAAEATLRGAESDFEQAERDLKKAELRAPFPGRIAVRSIEPFEEVTASQPAFVLQSEAALVVKVQVPEKLIRNVEYAQAVRVTFPAVEGVEVAGVVSLIGAQAGGGNAFRVEIQLAEPGTDLRPGMTARVIFSFESYPDGRTAYLIPLSAIAIDVGVASPESERDGRAPVFIFDEAVGRVKIRQVRIGGLRGNQLEVYEGLEPGDKVVSAGVAFLRDGMEAELWSPERGLGGG